MLWEVLFLVDAAKIESEANSLGMGTFYDKYYVWKLETKIFMTQLTPFSAIFIRILIL